jgi:hypothetical protein
MRAQRWPNPGNAGPFPALAPSCSPPETGAAFVWLLPVVSIETPRNERGLLGPGDNLPGAFARVELGEGNARERRDYADPTIIGVQQAFWG